MPRDFEFFHKSLLPKASDFAFLRSSLVHGSWKMAWKEAETEAAL
jgi:hypothetical protein